MIKNLIDNVGGQKITSCDGDFVDEQTKNLIATYEAEGIPLRISRDTKGQVTILDRLN